jgi:hypothetical protein
MARRGSDRVEVGDLARAHLHGAERDEVGAGVDRLGEPVGRHGRHRHAAALLDEEGKQRRGELDSRLRTARADPFAPNCGQSAPDRRIASRG